MKFINRNISINKIDSTKYNPGERTNSKKKHFKTLKEDIEYCGNKIVSPIVVFKTDNGRYQVIDGHRRTAAAKELNIKILPCRVVEIENVEKENNDELFGKLNRDQLKFMGKQIDYVFNNGGVRALTEKELKVRNDLRTLLGEDSMNKLYEKGWAIPTVETTITRVSNHLDDKDEGFQRNIFNFIYNTGKLSALRDGYTKYASVEQKQQLKAKILDPNSNAQTDI